MLLPPPVRALHLHLPPRLALGHGLTEEMLSTPSNSHLLDLPDSLPALVFPMFPFIFTGN